MNNKKTIIIMVVVIAILVVLVGLVLFFVKKDRSQGALVPVTPLVSNQPSPTAIALPQTNPFNVKTNPFKNVKTNPFE